MAPQGVWVGRAGWSQADSTASGNGIDFISDTQEPTGVSSGQGIIGGTGQIHFPDSVGDFGRFMVYNADIDTAHDPLEFGKFEHHSSQQICAGQQSGALSRRAGLFAAGESTQKADQLLHSFCLGVIGA